MLCGDSSRKALGSILGYVFELERAGKPLVSVCGVCAELVANAYNMKHNGDPILAGLNGWPEELEKPTQRQSLPQSTRTRIMERDEYRCVACGEHRGLTVDHIHPVLLGGNDDDENLQTLCAPCNASKGARIDWKGRKGVVRDQ